MNELLHNYIVELFDQGIAEFTSDTKTAGLLVDGKKKTFTDGISELSKKHIIFQTIEDPQKAKDIIELLKDNSIRKDFKESISNKRVKKDEKLEAFLANLKPKNIDLSHLQPYVDHKTGNKILWDMEKLQISEIEYVAYAEVLTRKFLDKVRESGGYGLAAFVYDPFNLYKIKDTTIDDQPASAINMYEPPAWRLENHPARYPEAIRKFLEFLFPIEIERNVVLTYLKKAILYRTSWILLLLGGKGLGKTLLADAIIQPLVSSKYFAKAQKGFFTGRFQDILLKNRFIFIDEVEAKDSESKKDLKRIGNKMQAVERKNKDVDQKPIFYSVMIANNAFDDIYIESDDRRFFIPQLNDKRLNEIIPNPSDMEKFIKEISDINNIASFGNYLISLEDDKNYNPENAFITPTFYRAVYESLKQTEQFVLEKVLESDSRYIFFSDLQEDYTIENNTSKKFFKPSRIKEFITNYLHEGNRVGIWVKYNGRDAIKVSEKFFKPPCKEKDKPSIDDEMIEELI